MVSQAKGGCSDCGSKMHTKMYHKERKPIKRSLIKRDMSLKMYDAAGKKLSSSDYKPRKKSTPRVLVKKPNKTLLKKKLEKLVKDYVKRRDDYTCQHCGLVVEGSNCHASHVIPVSRSGYLQFEPLNMKVLCYHDHINWWHKHPVEAGRWFTDTFPDRWDYLNELHIQRLKPMNVIELQEKIDYYKSLLQ